MQDTDVEGKLQNSHYDDERKTWDCHKYVAPHKEQYTIMESLTDYGYSGMDNDTKVKHFLQGIKVLSWRQQSMLSMPNQRNMAQISMPLCLIWAKWSQKKT